jgi:cyclopropane fatty-acyl-phospholipid synthase-like methyltransferase
MAELGWKVTGIDFSRLAIWLANRKIHSTGLQANFIRGDIIRSDALEGHFDFILDIGCFHSLRPLDRKPYTTRVTSRLLPGGTYLLYTWIGSEGSPSTGLPTKRWILGNFGEALTFRSSKQGVDRAGQKPSAWFTFQRSSA